MARELGLPEKVINKVPTADLWEGQSDEGELGITYPELDKILMHITEPERYPVCDSRPESIERVKSLILRSEFKRNMPPVLARIEC